MATTNGTKSDAEKAVAAEKAAATLAATPLSNVGGKNFWTVELVRPQGASTGLRSFVGMAEAAIQTAVDLLGRGMPTPPPKVDDLLAPAVYKTLGEGEASKAYQRTIDQVDARQHQLLGMDNKVVKSSITVAAEQNQTLRSIQGIVAGLNKDLKIPVATGKVKQSAREMLLLDKIATAVERVYEKVNAVAQLNDDIANGDSDSGASGQAQQTGGGNGGGGGDGGLGSLVQMLGMLPMMAAPLLSQIPELLAEQQEKAEEKQAEQAAQNPQNPGAAPADPNAPSAPGTQPLAPGDVAPTPNTPTDQGRPAEESGRPAASPATALAAGGLGVKPAARTKTPTAQHDSAQDEQPDDATDEEALATVEV
ncbi:hypothetical protein [Nocardia callitridis]